MSISVVDVPFIPKEKVLNHVSKWQKSEKAEESNHGSEKAKESINHESEKAEESNLGSEKAEESNHRSEKAEESNLGSEKAEESNYVTSTKSKEEDYSNVCWNCSKTKTEVQLYKCTGCKKARYCGKECIERDWPVHKNYCLKRQKKRKTKEA